MQRGFLQVGMLLNQVKLFCAFIELKKAHDSVLREALYDVFIDSCFLWVVQKQ